MVQKVTQEEEIANFELKLARVARTAIEQLRKKEPPALDAIDKRMLASVRHRLNNPTAEPESTQEAYLFTAIVLALAVDINQLRDRKK